MVGIDFRQPAHFVYWSQILSQLMKYHQELKNFVFLRLKNILD